MCQPKRAEKGHFRGGCCCGCCGCGCGSGFRRFFSQKEEKEALQRYKDELKKELAGLEEHLKGL